MVLFVEVLAAMLDLMANDDDGDVVVLASVVASGDGGSVDGNEPII